MPTTKILQQTNEAAIDLALDTIRTKKQALVFVSSKRSAEKTAEDIAKKLKSNTELEKLSELILKALQKPTKQCQRLAFCVKKGIAFHHAGLAAKQREVIEDSFRKGIIKIIAATPTLAQGIDIPAFRTILKSLKRYSNRGLNWIPVLEYMQMAGRCGRPNFDTHGEAIAVAKSEADKQEIYERYVCGLPEQIYSKLAVEPVLRTYLLSLIASDFVRNKEQILEFFSKTFWAAQFKDMQRLEEIIGQMLYLLEDFGFIIIEDDKIRATLIGKRVSQLYIDPLTAAHIIKCLKKAKLEKKIKTIAFLQMITNTLEMRPLLRIKNKDWADIEQKLVKEQDELLEKEPNYFEMDFEDFMLAFNTALFFEDWVNEKDEEQLLEKYNIRPGEIKVKMDIAKWLLYSAQELANLLEHKELIKEIIKLKYRVKYGAKEELLPLLRLKEIGRVRARRLFRAGIKDVKGVKSADITTLAQLLGKQIAINIKKQVGQDFSKENIKEKKGQVSLAGY